MGILEKLGRWGLILWGIILIGLGIQLSGWLGGSDLANKIGMAIFAIGIILGLLGLYYTVRKRD